MVWLLYMVAISLPAGSAQVQWSRGSCICFAAITLQKSELFDVTPL
jgi:hypothetical protein